jgi:hypothetical protein
MSNLCSYTVNIGFVHRHLPRQWLEEFLSQEVKGLELGVRMFLHRVTVLRLNKATPLLPLLSLWPIQE